MSLLRDVELTRVRKYDEQTVDLDRCPWCFNERIRRTPRRAPRSYHCKKCGFVAGYTDLTWAHDMLGHRAV